MVINTKANEIVLKAEKNNLTHQKMADICGVKITSIYRWKKTGRAKANVIIKLENYLESGGSDIQKAEFTPDIRLNEATLEDLSRRARELGFRASFTDIS
jgi:hypothetical protein